jgi:hypothetical protein
MVTVLFLGALAYEVTNSPEVGAAMVCLKFGFDDVASGVWLRRTDPWLDRGRASFWLYVASGLWKAAVVGNVFYTALAVIDQEMNGGRRNPNAVPPMFMGALVVSMVCFVLCAAAYWKAVAVAWGPRVRFWLNDPLTPVRRRDDRWPPVVSRWNWAQSVHITAVIAGCFAITIALAGVGYCVAELIRPGAATDFAGEIMLSAIGVLVTALPFIIRFSEKVRDRHITKNPDECWASDGPADWEAVEDAGRDGYDEA